MRRELCALQTATPRHLRLVPWHITTVLSVMTLADWVLRGKLPPGLNYRAPPFLSPVRFWWPSAGKWIFKMLPCVSRVCFPRLRICLWPWVFGFDKWGGERESRTRLRMQHGAEMEMHNLTLCQVSINCIGNLRFELGWQEAITQAGKTFIVPSTAIFVEYKKVISGWNTWRLNRIWFNQPNAIGSGLTKVWICIASTTRLWNTRQKKLNI